MATQVAWSRKTERRLPSHYSVDGNRQFQEALVPSHLRPDLVIYDVGGGKQPYLSSEQKQSLNARVIGIDIDPVELARAPEGAYDEALTADIAAVRGRGDADLVICQALLEHVRDTDGAIGSIASIPRPGGEALIFVPCRNALFARLNLLLPERVKRGLLFRVYPRLAHAQGFPSFYRNCTPVALSRLARKHGLEVAEVRTYWESEYFYAFYPAYLAWRSWLVLARPRPGELLRNLHHDVAKAQRVAANREHGRASSETHRVSHLTPRQSAAHWRNCAVQTPRRKHARTWPLVRRGVMPGGLRVHCSCGRSAETRTAAPLRARAWCCPGICGHIVASSCVGF